MLPIGLLLAGLLMLSVSLFLLLSSVAESTSDVAPRDLESCDNVDPIV